MTMHPEQFGKALGFGMREVGKAVARAVEAASSPAPANSRARRPPQQSLASSPAHTGGVRQGVRQFGIAVARPARRAGGVLWLEVTGFLFGLIALVAAGGVWAGRAHLRSGPGQAHELGGVAMLTIFSWFSITNFLRARRRSRQP